MTIIRGCAIRDLANHQRFQRPFLNSVQLPEEIGIPNEFATRQSSLLVVRGVVKQLPRETLGIHAQYAIEVTPSEELVASAPEFDGADGENEDERTMKDREENEKKQESRRRARAEYMVTARSRCAGRRDVTTHPFLVCNESRNHSSPSNGGRNPPGHACSWKYSTCDRVAIHPACCPMSELTRRGRFMPGSP